MHYKDECEGCGFIFTDKDRPADKVTSGGDTWYYCVECTNESIQHGQIDRESWDIEPYDDR